MDPSNQLRQLVGTHGRASVSNLRFRGVVRNEIEIRKCRADPPAVVDHAIRAHGRVAWLDRGSEVAGDFVVGSCPLAWCKSGGGIALSGGIGRVGQTAAAGRLTMGSSLRGAMVSGVM